MHIVDIFVLWLLTIAYVIGTRLLGNVLYLFTWISITNVC